MGISREGNFGFGPSSLFGFGAPAWSGTTDQPAPINAQVIRPVYV